MRVLPLLILLTWVLPAVGAAAQAADPATPPARPAAPAQGVTVAPRTAIPALAAAAPEPSGWAPLEHYTSPDGRDDFYTAAGPERAAVSSALRYRDLGPAGYVYTGPGGAVPLWRYYSPALGTHYYSPDPAQAPAGAGWVREGVAGCLAHGPVTAPGVTAVPAVVYVYLLTAPRPPALNPPPPPAGAGPGGPVAASPALTLRAGGPRR